MPFPIALPLSPNFPFSSLLLPMPALNFCDWWDRRKAIHVALAVCFGSPPLGGGETLVSGGGSGCGEAGLEMVGGVVTVVGEWSVHCRERRLTAERSSIISERERERKPFSASLPILGRRLGKPANLLPQPPSPLLLALLLYCEGTSIVVDGKLLLQKEKKEKGSSPCSSGKKPFWCVLPRLFQLPYCGEEAHLEKREGYCAEAACLCRK